MAFQLTHDAFRVFDEAALKFRTFVLAFSGGKDSTAVAVLLYRWLAERARRGERLPNVVLLHNDTLSEIPEMEEWVEYFVGQFKERVGKLGVRIRVVFARPRATETWYWRVFVRGYPAPTFNFRWCVDMLKIEPTGSSLSRYKNYVLVVGARDEESNARSKSMKERFGVCTGGGSCLGAYFTSNNDIPKVAPIRFWSYETVWAFLKAQKDFDVGRLVELYGGLASSGSLGGRYGCWHCTLVVRQAANYYREEYLYAEAIRLMYRAVSDLAELFRERKEGGYSRWGPLNPLGRAVIFNALRAAEELAGRRIFYGLDKARIRNLTLRKIFYEMDPEKADRVIARADPTDRRVPVAVLRDLSRHEGLRTALDMLNAYFASRNHRGEAADKALREILASLRR
jgi:DNA sulfur modification protein DndC